jgi:hypothetical protein
MPLVSQLSVCQTRRHAMFPVEANACLTGSYNSALNNRPQSSPAANNTFPFVSAAAAEWSLITIPLGLKESLVGS